MEGTNSKITMFAHFQEYHRNHKLFGMFLIVCKLNSLDITDSMLQTLRSDTKINILDPNLDVKMLIRGVQHI